MARLINADAVYKILESYEIRKETIGNPLSDWEYGYTCGIERAESEIECAPTIDAVPVRHGRWENCTNHESVDFEDKCSVCGYTIFADFTHGIRYCPNCGAKMDGEQP